MIVYAEPEVKEVILRFSFKKENYNKTQTLDIEIKNYKKLKSNIIKYGIVHPLIGNSLYKNNRNYPYVIKYGIRRFHIAKELGIQRIPILIYDLPILEESKKINCKYKYKINNMEDLSKLFKAHISNYQVPDNLITPGYENIPAGLKIFINLYNTYQEDLFK